MLHHALHYSYVDKIENLLRECQNQLGMSLGIVSQIENDLYCIYAVTTSDLNVARGEVFELGNTYCRTVVDNSRTMTFSDAAEIRELLKHPCYLTTQLRAYIGTPLIVKNRITGTINFSSRKPRPEDFSKDDFNLMDQLSSEISAIMANL